MSKANLSERSGQGLMEYAILVATLSLGLILLLGTFRNALSNVYRESQATLTSSSGVSQSSASGPLPILPPAGGGSGSVGGVGGGGSGQGGSGQGGSGEPGDSGSTGGNQGGGGDEGGGGGVGGSQGGGGGQNGGSGGNEDEDGKGKDKDKDKDKGKGKGDN